MSKIKRCPNCRLVSPGSAQICDCGYNFMSGELGDAPPGRSLPGAKSGGGLPQILFGAMLVVFGIVVTIVTHDAAVRKGGGTYVIAYGPMVAGAAMLIRGLAKGF